MIRAHRRPATSGILMGLLMFPLIRFLSLDPSTRLVLDIAGAAVLLWGSWHLMKGKGRHSGLAFLSLVPFGVVVLLVLDDRNPVYRVPEPEGVDLPRCPACDFAYRPSDYRPEAQPWLCSRCGSELLLSRDGSPIA